MNRIIVATLGVVAVGPSCANDTVARDLDYLENCRKMEVVFIMLENDIAADLAKVGITVNTRQNDDFNEAMV